MPCFWNQITIGPQTQNFQTDDNDDGAGMASHVLTNGATTWDALLNDIATDIATDIAAVRIGLSTTGHVTIDNNGGVNFRVVWTDTALRDLLGYTATTLTGANSYLAPRRIRAAYYPTQATVREHYPVPAYPMFAQTRALSGVTRTTIGGPDIDEAEFELQYLDDSSRLVSPAGAMATTYANAAATETGLTEYRHARDHWWMAGSANQQGWVDGRPVRYFANASDAVRPLAGGAWSPGSTTYTTWVLRGAGDNAGGFPATKMRPPRTIHHRLEIAATEYVAP